jgi:DNA-directed RNA polymerase subunit RPC12/RpoP
MTLPFQESSSRKYQCFVCGIQFDDYDKYREHVLEKHQEGREYVKCPLEHCQAPVRDVRLHFKAKHPKTPLPQKGMMRAMVWKDFSPGGEKRKTKKKPQFKEGWYQSTKMNKQIHYRSGYEATIYECLDCDADVNTFEAEPFEIPYIHKGKSHKYIPDIIVRFIDGRTEVWEVKPSNQTAMEQNQNKWEAAGRACKSRGWEFVVMTETGIEKLKSKVKEQQSKMRAFFEN